MIEGTTTSITKVTAATTVTLPRCKAMPKNPTASAPYATTDQSSGLANSAGEDWVRAHRPGRDRDAAEAETGGGREQHDGRRSRESVAHDTQDPGQHSGE